MRRIAIVGSSGSGKTRLARQLSAALGIPHIELDAVHHRPGWTAMPAEAMRRELDARCPADGAWVADGNYDAKGGDVIRRRADAVVWLDFDRRVVMRQLLLRTARRLVLRTELWNGNRELLRDGLSLHPERSVILWSWTNHAPMRARYAAQADERWVRLQSRAQVRRFLRTVSMAIGFSPIAAT
jgi:adenylate kinase family enzyme